MNKMSRSKERAIVILECLQCPYMCLGLCRHPDRTRDNANSNGSIPDWCPLLEVKNG